MAENGPSLESATTVTRRTWQDTLAIGEQRKTGDRHRFDEETLPRRKHWPTGHHGVGGGRGIDGGVARRCVRPRRRRENNCTSLKGPRSAAVALGAEVS